jgi:hypothetical protein
MNDVIIYYWLEDWTWSTYHRYVRDEFYGNSIYLEDVIKIVVEDFGE